MGCINCPAIRKQFKPRKYLTFSINIVTDRLIEEKWITHLLKLAANLRKSKDLCLFGGKNEPTYGRGSCTEGI
jgi:hypothetical protein